MKYLLAFLVLGLYAQVAQAEGGYEFAWKLPSQAWYFDNPFGVAVDSFGNVYVADTENHRIQKFTPDGSGRIYQLGGNISTG